MSAPFQGQFALTDSNGGRRALSPIQFNPSNLNPIINLNAGTDSGRFSLSRVSNINLGMNSEGVENLTFTLNSIYFNDFRNRSI